MTECLQHHLIEAKSCVVSLQDIHDLLKRKAEERGLRLDLSQSKIQQKVLKVFPRTTLRGLAKQKHKRKYP